MTINVPGLPADIRVPFLYFGIDASRAGFFQQSARILVIGQMLAAGTATADQPIQIFANEDKLFGTGSMLANMVKRARETSGLGEIWALPLADNPAGVKDVKTLTVTGAPHTNSETLSLLISGKLIQVAVGIGDSDDDVAAKIDAAVNADPYISVASTVAANVVTLEAKHAGVDAGNNNIKTAYSYLNITEGNAQVAVANPTPGAGNPVVSAAAYAALGTGEFDWTAFPYTDAANLAALDGAYDDVTGRWSALTQLYGHAFTVVDGNAAALAALGATLNNQHLSVLGLNGSPTPSYEIAAILAAKGQVHLSSAPELSRPLQTVELQGVLSPVQMDQFDVATRQALYFDGIGATKSLRNGAVTIDRLLTTYQTNNAGGADTAYLDVQTVAQLQYVIRFLNAAVQRNHGRAALRDDDESLVPGGNIITRPKDVKATIASAAYQLFLDGVIENHERFVELLTVERSADDPNCLEMVVSPDFVNQFRIGKILVQFYNQYPETGV